MTFHVAPGSRAEPFAQRGVAGQAHEHLGQVGLRGLGPVVAPVEGDLCAMIDVAQPSMSRRMLLSSFMKARFPLQRVATTGSRQAMASSIGRPQPSPLDALT